MFGLSESDLKILNELVIEPLKLAHAEVYVFGSRARGTHHKFSDIDLLFIENSQTPIQPMLIAKIKSDIEDSNITIKVDLVNKKHLANSYLESVQRDMKPV